MKKQQAEFVERTQCINCGSTHLTELSNGRFGDEPLRTFIEKSPWGDSPLPYIENEQWVYVRCHDCTQMFHKRVLSPVWNEKRFSEWMTEAAIRQFEKEASVNTPPHIFNRAKQHVLHVLRLEKMTRELCDNEAVRVLDFGCGWGDFLAMCDHFGFTACGIDRSSSRRSGGMQNVQIFPEIEYLKTAPEAAHGFHVVTLFEVLEHLDTPLAVLQLLRDFLVPNGILVLETPDCTNVTDVITEIEYLKIHPLDHINGFTPYTLRTIAARAGFRLVRPDIAHATCDSMSVVKNEVKRLIGGLLKPRTQQYFRKV